MLKKYNIKGAAILFVILIIGINVFSQSKHEKGSGKKNRLSKDKIVSDSSKVNVKDQSMHDKLLTVDDTLSLSDYLMSIQRVGDKLNAISDSATLNFELPEMSKKLSEITNNIKLIRQNVRGRNSIINIKNLYLYMSFASNWNNENSQIEAFLNGVYRKTFRARLQLKIVLSDSIFRKLYADSNLRAKFERKLIRLEKKWSRTDSVSKASLDSLNSLKVKATDNAISLSGLLRIMDRKLGKALPNLFGNEVRPLWEKAAREKLVNDTSQKTQNLYNSEKKAIGYYFDQTSNYRAFIFVIGFMLFVWLFTKRKLLKTLRTQKESYTFLHLQYLNSYPVLSVLVMLLCLTPFFDAYAPTSYIAIEYLLLLPVTSVIFFRSRERAFFYNWLALVVLFVAGILTYLFIIPTFLPRLGLLALHAVTIVFMIRFLKKMTKQMPYYKWIRVSVITGVFLCLAGIMFNLFGRFSLAGISGIAGIFAVVQAIVLPVFIDTIIEFIILQVQSSRVRKGVDKPFDSSIISKKIKMPLLIIAVILWIIMLASNLNIYHNISINLVTFLTTERSIGSISYKLISVLLFFVVIWLAHIVQRLVGFLFGETGIETDDMTAVSKSKHSRLLITKLLILISGYLLAIAASGLPLDKLTIVIGAMSVGIGMGLQNVVNNFVSGIILIFDGSLKIGDQIEVNGQAGNVKEIGLRASTLNTSDGAEVIIPNGTILSQNIVNWTYSNDEKRVIIFFTVTGKELDSNIVNDLINNTIKDIPNVIARKKPEILYNRVRQESCAITVRFWSAIGSADSVKSEAMVRLSTAFAGKSIEFE
jgi:small-conductance mechanosensitive channel